MTQRRCMGEGCRHFYDIKLRECPECGTPKHAPNKWLVTATMNNSLYEQAHRAAQNA